MGKTGPVPPASTPTRKDRVLGTPGCGANPAILRSRPRQWGRHSLRARSRLAGFSLTTPSIPVVLADSLLPAKTLRGRMPVEVAVIEGRSAISTTRPRTTGRRRDAHEVPVAGHPVAVIPVAGHPHIARSGAWGNVRCRRADVDSEYELPGRAPRSSPELRLSKLLPTSTASCCP